MLKNFSLNFSYKFSKRRRRRKKFIIALDFIIPNLQNPSLSSSSSSSRTHKEKNLENLVMLPFRLSVVVMFLLLSLLLLSFCLCIRSFLTRPNDGEDGLGLGLDGLSRFVEALDCCNGKECLLMKNKESYVSSSNPHSLPSTSRSTSSAKTQC